jgi:hypothetical protein
MCVLKLTLPVCLLVTSLGTLPAIAGEETKATTIREGLSCYEVNIGVKDAKSNPIVSAQVAFHYENVKSEWQKIYPDTGVVPFRLCFIDKIMSPPTVKELEVKVFIKSNVVSPFVSATLVTKIVGPSDIVFKIRP